MERSFYNNYSNRCLRPFLFASIVNNYSSFAAPYAGLSYAVHDYAENGFKTLLKTEQLPFFYKFLCGSIAGVGGTLMTYPLGNPFHKALKSRLYLIQLMHYADVLRVRLALGGTWASSIKQGGFSQGLFPTLIGESNLSKKRK